MNVNSINKKTDIPNNNLQISSKLAECSWYMLAEGQT
jgi:hypothetical protein